MSGLVHPASVPDAGAFLVRLVRLDPAALVRLRPGGGLVGLWGRLPWDVLVTRTVRGEVDVDATVRAGDLLNVLSGHAALPARHDAAWRWPLPHSAGRVVEHLPAAEVRRIGAAAASTVRTAAAQGIAGRPVGSRMLRDAMLDHVPIVVDVEGQRVEVGQRLVQAVVQMGFLGRAEPPSEPPSEPLSEPPCEPSGSERFGSEPAGSAESAGSAAAAGVADPESVAVRVAGRWVGLSAGFGTAWQATKAGILTLHPAGMHTQ